MKKFHLIARAVILKDNNVLLAHQKGADNTFLPGGHIEIGESAVTTLRREINEELGLNLGVGEYLGAVEAGFKDDEAEHFEINHIFNANIRDIRLDLPIVSCEDHLGFFWSSIDDLEKNNLEPYPLRKLITRYVAGDKTIWWESTLI